MSPAPAAGLDPEQRTRRLRGGLLLALLLTPLLIYPEPVLRNEIPLGRDGLAPTLPLHVHAHRLMAQGHEPFWNRCEMAGVPLYAHPRARLLDPLHWPFLIRPSGVTLSLALLLRIGLLGSLTAWLVWRLTGATWIGGWAGAVALCAGWGWHELARGDLSITFPAAVAWLGAGHAWRGSGRRRWLAAGVLAVAAMTTGEAQLLVAAALAAMLHLGLLLLLDTQGRVRIAMYLVATGAIGVALSAPIWLPRLSYLRFLAGDALFPLPDGSGLAGWHDLSRALAGDWSAAGRAQAPFAGPSPLFTSGLGLAIAAIACVPPGSRRAWRRWLAALAPAAVCLLMAFAPVQAALTESAPRWLPVADAATWLAVGMWYGLLAAAVGLAGVVEGRQPARPRDARPGSLDPLAEEPWAGEQEEFSPGRAFTIPRWARFLPAFGVLMLLTLPQARGIGFGRAAAQALLQFDLALFVLIAALLARRQSAVRTLAALLVVAVLSLGWRTWRSTDPVLLPAEAILTPPPRATEAARLLQPGERLLSFAPGNAATPASRFAWLEPSLAPLWGIEQIGGDRGGASASWREWLGTVLDENPVRGEALDFALPVRAPAYAAANVRAALIARWGFPLNFTQLPGSDFWLAPFPERAEGALRVSFIYRQSGEPTSDPRLVLAHAEGVQWLPLDPSRRLEQRDDVPTTAGRVDAPIAPDWRIATGEVDVDEVRADAWMIQLPPEAELVDGFAWSEQLAALWRPLPEGSAAGAAILADFTGGAQWAEWSAGGGTLLARKITPNRIDLEVRVSAVDPATGTARLVLHEAAWPGWRARIDGQPALLDRQGPWRALELPSGAREIRLRYEPAGLRQGLLYSAWALVALAVIFARARRRSGRIEWET
ncbi:MAG TPA: hypothetical protein PLG73_01500 [Candidatus Sumerlaeota bacterium]|nr:hypothetical protein [Candidatus Sumerlaeota bacterium]